MKKITIVILASLVVFLISSCASYRFVPQPGENIEIQQNRAKLIPVYQDDSLGLQVIPSETKGKLFLQVIARNLSFEPVTLADKDFLIFGSRDSQNWDLIPSYDSMDYLNSEKSAYTAGLVFHTVVTGLSVASAGYETETSYTTHTVYENGEVKRRYRTSTTKTYDPLAAELSRERAINDLYTYARNGQEWIDFLEKNLFFRTNLAPSDEYFGFVVANWQAYNFYKVAVTLPGGRTAEFSYQRVRE